MSKLTPGERAINWAKALGLLATALAALLGYTNKEHIANWIAPGDIVATSASVDDRMTRINEKFAEQDARMEKLEKRDASDQYKLQSQINALKEWH